MAVNEIITSGTFDLISAGQTDTGDTVAGGGVLEVAAGGAAVDTTIAGAETVADGGSDDAALILNGGVQTVDFDGVASGATIDGGGTQIVQSGGVASDTVISGGTLEIANGGVTSGDILSGGIEIVASGGIASNPVISGGTLDIQYGGALSGAVTFGNAGTLQIDGTTMPAATITGFTSPSQTIDLTGLAYASDGSATLTSGNVLQVSESGQTASLQLDPSQNYTGHSFTLASDGHGGTTIVDPVVGLNTWTVGAEGGANSSGLNGVIQAIDAGGGNQGTNVDYTIDLTGTSL